NVAPVSWLVQRDVQEGRSALNVSTGNRVDTNEMVEKIRGGDMPPLQYTIIHRNASLSGSQKDALIAGLQATFGNTGPGTTGVAP
ncbi:MAG: heme-binding domain-containing protein, partial [Thermoleophilia bacterium]